MIRFHDMQLPDSDTGRAFATADWCAVGLGPPQDWPESLRVAAQLCLNARFPMTLVWGDRDIIVYNDGFVPILGERHPAAFGRPVLDVYAELGAVIGPVLEDVRRGGQAVYEDDRLLPLMRQGRVEEAYFKLSCSPVCDGSGQVRGALCVAEENSTSTLQLRRSRSVGGLAETLARHASADSLLPEIRRVLAGNPMDFAATAMFEEVASSELVRHWSSPGNFAGDLVDGGALVAHLDKLPRQGRHAGVDELAPRVFALSVVDDGLLPGRRFVLVVRPDDLVRTGSSYRTTLRVVLDTIVGATYRVLLERRAMAEMEGRLGERDRLYRALFEHSHDSVFICAPGGDILAANPAACGLLGYTEREINELGRAGIVADEDGSLSEALTARSSAGKFSGELKFRHKDGRLIQVDVSSTLFEDELTGDGRAVVFFRDAQPRLAAQKRIATTARLEAVGSLTGGIAHDFNNLLNVIINGTEDLAERIGHDGEARSHAELVLTASSRAADLTRQLLAFSRQQPMALTRLDLAGVVTELDQIIVRTIGAGIEVEIDVAEGLAVQADVALLQSAILNLCINARDAMPDGGRLRIRGAAVPVDPALAAELGLPAGRYARLSVEDTGVGIAPENLGRVLEPFFTTKPAGQGTGLGLSTVFGFMHQVHGSMRVLSEPRVGTHVELYLPLAEPVALADCTAAAPPSVPEPREGGSRVLVVEDDDLFSEMLANILEGAGYEVTVCATGEAAVAALDAGEGFEAMITDILLGPGMDGWAVAAHAGACCPGMPVVTMSGYAGRDHDYQGPSQVTLQKPFRPREILTLLKREVRAA